ncbi:hypothetical protein HZS_2886 [Henneguya salminicola]|nr:hypothetical protein HZS_2886 [Henneguya salminicola]
MSDLSKKDLLELRLNGSSNIQGQMKNLINNGWECDSNLSKLQLLENLGDESQKSLNENDSQSRGRKRKSYMKEPVQIHEKQRVEPLGLSMMVPQKYPINSLPTSILNEMSMDELKRRNLDLENAIREMIEREKRSFQILDISREWLINLLIKDYKIRKKQVMDLSIENCKRLGCYTTVRKGAQFVEGWQEGFGFKNIENLIIENNRMKDELEKARKAINKRKPNDKLCSGIRSPTEKVRRQRVTLSDSTSFNSPIAINQIFSVEEYQRLEELYKIRLSILKKEEIELNNEKEKLERERDVHIKSLKCISMEEASRFNDNRTMNNRYLLLELIGKGGFSEAFDLNEFKYVASKIHQLNSDWRDEKKANYIKHAVREYNIHKTLDHPNIVKLLDVFEIDNDSFATIMEYCDGNDLDSLLKQSKYIPEREARFIIVQIVLALRYLNERRPPVIHYDLKPGNILLLSGANAWHAKITDFGLSKIIPEDHGDASMELTSPGAGTYWYLPPECFYTGLHPAKISSKVDVWSVGIIFYQCLFGKKPFGNDLSQTNILEQQTILNATRIIFPPKPIISNEAKNFIKSCLVYSKENRMDVNQMSEQQYIKCRKAERSLPPLSNLKIEDNST